MADNINDIDLAYFAGFFDGEGCVAIYPKKYVVCLTNTDIRPLVIAQGLWGGSVSCQKKEGREFALQDLWRWSLYGHKSMMFLQQIRPFTKIKNDQIDCYLETMKHVPTYRGGKYKVGDAQKIKESSALLKLLKRSNSNE